MFLLLIMIYRYLSLCDFFKSLMRQVRHAVLNTSARGVECFTLSPVWLPVMLRLSNSHFIMIIHEIWKLKSHLDHLTCFFCWDFTIGDRLKNKMSTVCEESVFSLMVHFGQKLVTYTWRITLRLGVIMVETRGRVKSSVKTDSEWWPNAFCFWIFLLCDWNLFIWKKQLTQMSNKKQKCCIKQG